MTRRCDGRSPDDKKGYGATDPLWIETDRLVIRPIDDDDSDTFHAIAGQREVALMLASIIADVLTPVL